MDYLVEENHIRLSKVTKTTICIKCRNTLALFNGRTVLIKSFISVLKNDNSGDVILKCGKCGTLNEFNLNIKDSQKLFI